VAIVAKLTASLLAFGSVACGCFHSACLSVSVFVFVVVVVLCLSQICDETGTVNCGNLCCQRPSVCFPRYNSLDFQCPDFSFSVFGPCRLDTVFIFFLLYFVYFFGC